MKQSFDFYEFVAILVPGSLFLVSTSLLFDLGAYAPYFTPVDLGSFGVFVILAYLAGHLIQAVGNWFEYGFWWLFKGMPSDWPITHSTSAGNSIVIESICNLTHQNKPDGSAKEILPMWQALVRQGRSTVYATPGRATRLQFFLGNYDMFRGIVAASILIAIEGAVSQKSPGGVFYAGIAGIFLLALYRMYRFAQHYCRELFANIAELSKSKKVGE